MGLAWCGIWGPWVPGQNVSLIQNALDLAEWSTFLPEVRTGTFRLMPEVLRLGIALGITGIMFSLVVIRYPLWRWIARTAALLPAIAMLPPYPWLLNLWFDQSYGWRFGASSFALIGWGLCFITDKLPRRVTLIISSICCVGALALSAAASIILFGPFRAHYGQPLYPGLGAWLFWIGMVTVMILQWIAEAVTSREARVSPPT